MKRSALALGTLALVVVSALTWAQASLDSIETQGVRFGTGAALGTVTEKVRITQDGNVGIGTQSPTTTIQVSGSLTVSTSAQTSTPSLYVGTNGNVGIGTSNPVAPLHIDRSGYLQKWSLANVLNSNLMLWGTDNASDPGPRLSFLTSGTAFEIFDQDAGGGTRMFVTSSTGLVGIGTTSPLAKFDVAGTISASDAIQVGSSSLSCTAGIPGAIRYNSGNIQFCNGTSWATVGTSTAPGSSGDIVFNNGSGFAADNGQLYWDATNNRLGIGTASPDATLHVNAGSAASLTPKTGFFQIGDDASGANINTAFDWQTIQTRTGGGAAANLFINPHGGNVGIGTTSPQATLQVSGSFVVSTSAQPYTSPSLYVDTMGRTAIGTNVPSALFSVVSYTAGLANSNGIYVRLDQNPASTPNAHYRGLYVINDYVSSQNATSANSVRGGEFVARSLGTGNVSYTYGLLAYGQSSGGSSVTGNAAIYGFASVSNSTASTYMYGAQLYTYDYNGPGVGGVGNAYGAMIQGYSNAGRMTNYYGLYLANFAGIDPSGNFYGVYVDDAAMDNFFAGTVGVGTTSIPHGAIGYAKFAMDGAEGSGVGPHTQYTVSTDDYPVFQQLNWTHDNISLNFDSYFDGAWRSSDPGSNFQIYKVGDVLKLTYDSGIAAGSAVTWNDGIVLNTSGYVGIGAAPSSKLHVNGGRTQIGSTATDYASTGYDWNFNLLIDALDTSSIGFHDAGNTVGMISFQGGTFKIGADAGWGNATVIAAPPMMLVADEKAAGTAGGTATSGAWQTRTLNTVNLNTITGASLASNQITLPAGTYLIRASAPVYNVNRHQTRLYNVTDAAVAIEGTSDYVHSTYGGSNRSFVIGQVNITASKTFRLEHRVNSTQASNGFGVESNFGSIETYSTVEITQIR